MFSIDPTLNAADLYADAIAWRPAPQHVNPSRPSDAIYLGVDGGPLRPFTALTQGHHTPCPKPSATEVPTRHRRPT